MVDGGAAPASRHRPERRCIACGRRGPQESFLRYRAEEVAGSARVRMDEPGSPRLGRGAYVCPRRACMDRALRRRALQKALRVSAIVDADELLEALERLLEEETGIVGR
jgi:predicted RNA-binding protein YlxR (DUF448 family)